ncbi:hypothetical protein [Streptomyces sp. NPDC090083]|uniref:hypothetical protein n=1 Tax=Streptomyces sp. NPDC090083 TaxID=3365941 RepID=UPI0038040CC4
MNTQANRVVGRLLTPLLAVCLLAGCGGGRSTDGGRASGQPAPAQEKRAREVADAWRESEAAAAWNQGYYPMADAIQPVDSGWHTTADERAYKTGNIFLSDSLPTTAITQGTVKWRDGGSLNRPLMEATKAYQSFARTHNAERPRLTVTAAKLGETTLTTSRGPATVPAWLFTIEGYDAPLKRVAVTPSPLPEPPIEPTPEGFADGIRSVTRLAGTAVDGRSITVGATHGACDDGPVVRALETDESIVLYASVARERSGPCTAQLIEQNVTLKLRQPLAHRILLDARTGRPVPYGLPNGPTPSWT